MICPNCGLTNEDGASYCSECAVLLRGSEELVKEKLKQEEIAVGISKWLIANLFQIAVVFTALLLVTTSGVAIYDILAGHTLLAGLGPVLALVGGIVFAVSTFELSNFPEKYVLKAYPTPAYYRTVFTPLMSAMRSTPRTFHDNTITVLIASLLLMLLGLVIMV
jgi:hypothetical protein